jgi:ATP phosphoribosyltransferase
LQEATARLLAKAGFELGDYRHDSRLYRPQCQGYPQLLVKVFQERDIAIQIAVGNYDLGICGLDWVEEFFVRYGSDALIKVRELGYGERGLYAAVSEFSGITSLRELRARSDTICLVSEYPNLAESFALKLRLRRFKVLPLWGAAEVYPPENADLVIIPETSEERLLAKGLLPLATILTSSAILVANKEGVQRRDISPILVPLCSVEVEAEGEIASPEPVVKPQKPSYGAETVFLALPDGHQQYPTIEFLREAGLEIEGYRLPLPTRRPSMRLDGVSIKVVRPQDMPLQVANGNFDLAITGRDWLLDHLYRFPSSPVRELLDLGFGKVRIVALVSWDFPVEDVAALRRMLSSGQLPTLRLASEYINIADKYARDNHLSPYKVIPTWGATEAFLPEDADVLIENTETGRTISEHNLKIIDTILESSACLIGNKQPPQNPIKSERMAHIIEALKRARGLRKEDL